MRIAPGEGLIGQCYSEQKRILLNDAPADYLRISSALGTAKPVNVVVEPIKFEGRTKAVLELASLQPFTSLQLEFVERLAANLGIVLHNIEVQSTAPRNCFANRKR